MQLFRKCDLCGKGEATRFSDVLNVCTDCENRLKEKIAVICVGCDTCWWLPKTKTNNAWAASIGNVSEAHVLSNAIMVNITGCKFCEVNQCSVQRPAVVQ